MKESSRPRLLCITHLPPPVNGVTMMGQVVAGSALLQDRFDVTVLPIRSATSIPDIGRFRVGKFLGIVRFAKELFVTCARRRPDLVYFTITPVGVAFYRDLLYVAILKLFGITRVYHLHGKGIAAAAKGPVRRAVYRFGFRGACVILLSSRLYRDLASLVPMSNVDVLPNGIRDPAIAPTLDAPPRQASPPRLLFFSNIIVNKGPFVLLEALALLKERRIPFRAVFAGAWESLAVEELFHATVERHALATAVSYVGPRYSEEKEATFAEADIKVFPTYNDTYPLVLIEAMAHGLPVVATYEGAIPDIIEDGVTGFLVPTRNVGALADRIALLLGDEGLRKAMGKRARRRYEERHQLDRFERELVRILAARLKDGPTWLNGRGGDAAP